MTHGIPFFRAKTDDPSTGQQSISSSSAERGDTLGLLLRHPADGNPHACNLFEVVRRIQQHEGDQLDVTAVR